MEEDIQKQIEARLAELPKDIQEAVLSTDLSSRIQAIGAKYQLHVDQIGILEEEVMMVMLGFSNPATFAEQLVEALQITPDVAGQLAQDIAGAIFLPIRESMQAFIDSQPEQEELEKNSDRPQAPDLSTLEILPPKTLPELPKAEVALSQPTAVTTPLAPQPPAPQAPKKYSTDPYREPPE